MQGLTSHAAASRIDLWAIAFRAGDWASDTPRVDLDGSAGTALSANISFTGTCVSVHYNAALTSPGKHAVVFHDDAGDAQFLVTHARILVDAAAPGNGPGATPIGTGTTIPVSTAATPMISTTAQPVSAPPTTPTPTDPFLTPLPPPPSTPDQTLIDGTGTTLSVPLSPTSTDVAPESDPNSQGPQAATGAADRICASDVLVAAALVACFVAML